VSGELLDFKVHERLGSPVCDLEAYAKTGKLVPLDSRDDLPRAVYDGRAVAVEFMGAVCRWTIERCGDGWTADGAHNAGCVEWSEKDGFWVVMAWYNKEVLKRFHL
jgi:hypothetical protein